MYYGPQDYPGRPEISVEFEGLFVPGPYREDYGSACLKERVAGITAGETPLILDLDGV